MSNFTRVRKGLLRRVRRQFKPAFERAVSDTAVPMSLDMRRDSRTLMIAFGGRPGGLGMPPFEFFRITGSIRTKRMFVRDLRQAWYHEGVEGAGETITEMAESFAHVIGQHEFDRLVVTGISAGGYAALLFGTLLGADVVVAFSPQTVIDPDAMAAMDDHRYDDPLVGLAAAGRLDERWTDLREALPPARSADTLYELHFDPSSRPDRLHAERLAELPGVRLHRHEGAGHNIPKVLREEGKLESVLLDALEVPRVSTHDARSSAGY
jgi:hypothetical protein